MDTNISKDNSIDFFAELIGKIYQAGLDGQWTHVLDKLIAYTGSNNAFLFLKKHGESFPLLLNFRTSSKLPTGSESAYQQITIDNPIYEIIKIMLEGDCIQLTCEMNKNESECFKSYKGLNSSSKTKHSIASLLISDIDHESIFAINRGEHDPKYELAELKFMSIMTPHLSRAVKIFKDITLYKNFSAINRNILDLTDKGILVCNEHGYILQANAFANKVLSCSNDVKIVEKTLTISPSIYNKRFKQCLSLCINQAGTEWAQESILMERVCGESILITISPLYHYSTLLDISQPCCLVTLTKQNAVNWQALTKEFALTPKELSLIQSINQKKKLQQLTVELGVTYNTLASHLKAIYKKMRIHSQAELIVTLSLFKN